MTRSGFVSPPAVRHRDETRESPTKPTKPLGRLVGSSPRLLQGLRGASGPDGVRSAMPVGSEPRVEVEAHRGPSPVWGPDRLRANPAQLFEALERALHDPGLRQPGPLLAVHLARGD